MTDNTQTEYEKLKNDISFHLYRYHVLDDPVISDAEYDMLLQRLKEMEAVHPEWVAPDSPTQRVGGEAAARFVKVLHPAPILSLSNAFSLDDLRAWLQRVSRLDARAAAAEFVIEPKIDGLTVVCAVPHAETARWGRISPPTCEPYEFCRCAFPLIPKPRNLQHGW